MQAATIASTSVAFETSAVCAIALPPSLVMIFTVSSAAAALRSTQNTCAPSRAKVTAVALPLPQPGPIEPAPTTIATLPLSRSIPVLPHGVVVLRAFGPRRGCNTSRLPLWQHRASARSLAPNRPARDRSALGECHHVCEQLHQIFSGSGGAAPRLRDRQPRPCKALHDRRPR